MTSQRAVRRGAPNSFPPRSFVQPLLGAFILLLLVALPSRGQDQQRFGFPADTTFHPDSLPIGDPRRGDILPGLDPQDTVGRFRRMDPWDTIDAQRRRQVLDSLLLREERGEFDDDELDEYGDPIAEQDTGWVVYLDSTARMEQFVHRRHDAPTVELFPRTNYSLYLDVKSPAYKREFQMDSAGMFVTVRERVNGLDVKEPAIVSVEEYIERRREHEIRSTWRSLATEYKVREVRDELASLLGSLTNIEIPVPANPLLSIFGGRGIKLNVSGRVDIRGAFRNSKSDQVTVSRFDQSRSEPDFNQDVQINVNGTVGDKLDIRADWNTRRTFEYENSLKIKYTGYEDEIVQTVEAGNVSLQTPSLVGGGQALFGIKAKLQTGPLTLTTLLSQKKGQTRELSVSGGAQSQTIDILPHQYARNYYFIDTVYRGYYETLFSTPVPVVTDEMVANQIIQLDVWRRVFGQAIEQAKIEADAYIDLPPHPAGESYQPDVAANLNKAPGRFEQGFWLRLDPRKDYKVFERGSGFLSGIIVLNSTPGDEDAYAVSYTVIGSRNPANPSQRINMVYGDSVGGKMFLKLVRPRRIDQNPSYKPAWDLMLKNVYSVGGRDLKREGFELQIGRRTEGPEEFEIFGQNLLRVLGLDRFNDANQEFPDDQFDFISGLTVDIDRADLIFPSLRPFDRTIERYFQRSDGPRPPPDTLQSYLFGDMYDTTVTAAQNNTIRNRYIIHVKSSTSQSSRYNLGFNLVEGSVQVLLNGIPMQQGVDYTVDYIIGEVVIRNPQALAPGANVQVKYEQNDLFQLASKTLIGARGEMPNLFPNTNVGFTIMSLNQATLSDKVRLGEEPTNNMIMGVDGNTSFNLPILTTLVDALPLIRTKEQSTVRIGGEAAMVIPNPNTKRSTILGDEGSSIAYLDDFEGARRTIPIPLNFGGWHLASVPESLGTYSSLPDTQKAWRRAKLDWYTRLPSDVLSQDIWPNKSVRRGQELVTVMNLDYYPTRRGPYNFSLNLEQTLRTRPDSSWAGVMRYISNAAGLVDQNIAYLEVWLQASSSDPDDLRRGRLYIDLGRISEDVIPNSQLNSEDIVKTALNPLGIKNGSLQPGEDIGLDMLADTAEQRVYADFLRNNVGDPDVNPADPSGDNWSFSVGGVDFSRINGTENNSVDVNGRLPDTEDLNDNGIADLDNQYIEYEIPLDTVFYSADDGQLQRNKFYVGGNPLRGWYQLRIPLQESSRIINAGSQEDVLRNVQYIRLWLSGFTKPVIVRLAEVNLVGNQWLERFRNDSTLKASVVNIEDNPEYRSPPGVIRERDRTQPDQIIEGNEQSLALLVRGLERGDSRHVYRSFNLRPLNLINYRSMRMFIHGDSRFAYYAPDRYDSEIFIRFGADSLNFYEYRQPIRPGWDPQNDLRIDFGQLTAVKAARDSANRVYRVSVPDGPAGATFGVLGNPSLTQVREIVIGIANPSEQGGPAPLFGDVWINELRLLDVDDASGLAYRFDTQVKLADLGGVGFNYSKTDPHFHGLSDRFGTNITQQNWAINSNVALDKFFPRAWQGTTIQFGYSHSEQLGRPKYLPNTDIVVTEAATRAASRTTVEPQRIADSVETVSQTLRVQDSYSIPNFRLALPVEAWYIRDTWNKLSMSFNYTKSHERNPSIAERRAWGWNFRASYGVSIPSDYYIQPFKSLFSGVFLLEEFKDWKLYYVPITNLSGNLGGQRSRTFEQARSFGSLARDTRGFSAGKSFGFGWKFTEGGLTNLSGDYGSTVDRNLLHLDNDTVGRDFRTIVKNLLFGGEDTRYGQRVTVNSRPRILSLIGISKYVDLTAGYSVNYSWQNSFQRGDLGKSAGWDNSINASITLRLKSLTDPWFASADRKPDRPASSTKPGEKTPAATDTSKSTETGGGPGNVESLLSGLRDLARVLIKVPFLDYENISLTFTQSNRVASGGVLGRSGFMNFWGRLPFQGSLPEHGPSRLYQLGLMSDPSGTLRFKPTSSFPFLGWETTTGLRAPDAQIPDQFNQSNSLTLRTNRPLWTGASMEINWKVGWQFNRLTTSTTDATGMPTPNTITTAGSVERSFLTLPPFLFLKALNSNLEDVGKKYDVLTAQGTPAPQALAESFEKGLEALPFLNRFVGNFVPRPNWTLRWDGIERVAGLKSFLNKLSLEHNYGSSFRRDFRGDPSGRERTDMARVQYGFTPLAGVNFGFKELLSGNMSGSLRYTTTTSLDLNIAAQNIVEDQRREVSLTINYGRRGFKLPLFGLNLSNDVDVSMNFSRSSNARRTHDPRTLSQNQKGIPLEGSTRTLMEPRIRYVLSSRVSAALFYRFTKVSPDEGGSRIFGTTTNEAGLDIQIQI